VVAPLSSNSRLAITLLIGLTSLAAGLATGSAPSLRRVESLHVIQTAVLTNWWQKTCRHLCGLANRRSLRDDSGLIPTSDFLPNSAMRSLAIALLFYAAAFAGVGGSAADSQLERVQYNNPGLVVDLGVGLWAWPLPMDYDGDGDWDLVVSCPDKPYNGTWLFENPGPHVDQPSTINHQPVFRPGVRIADGPTSVQVSFVDKKPIVMTPGKIYANFREHQYAHPIELPLPAKIDPQYERYRANQWRLVDFDADGDQDVIVGIELWDDYGWDDAWDEDGNWKNGPLHGYVYLVENVATGRCINGKTVTLKEEQAWPEFLGPRPVFAPAVKLNTTDGAPIDVFGMPSPSFNDFDADGDLDLVCGEFLDGFTHFQNTGTRAEPRYSAGVKLPVHMDLQMITPTAVDWDNDGDPDLICGDEDGRVAFLENKEINDRIPDFAPPVYFQQEAADVKFGALAAPCSVDWDGDGDEDLVCGNTAGYIGFIENLDGGNPPVWAAPVLLNQIVAEGATLGRQVKTIRHAAGPRGSIQGPCEAKWGYTTLTVADWDNSGVPDVIVNDIWGRPTWYQDRNSTVIDDLGPPRYLQVNGTETPAKPSWLWWTPDNNQLATEWRTTPCAVDWNDDGLMDLVMLDHEGYLAFFERSRDKIDDTIDTHGATQPLFPGQRLFKIEGSCEFDGKHQPVGEKKNDLLRLNAGHAGKSGRRKLHIVDWDGDGRRDLLVNSVNVNWLRNVRTDDEGFVWFRDEGPLDKRILAGHDTAPTTVDWDRNGIPDLLVGAEDGRMYYKRNPRADQ